MKIDLKRLHSDVKRLKARRAESPIGKTKTGATEIIRTHFDELELMFRDGSSWTEIAAALAAQGVTQGEGQPLTGRRLTALMHNIRVRAQKLKSGVMHRGKAKTPSIIAEKRRGQSTKKISLSPDMNRARSQTQPEDTIGEDEIRRTELSKHAHLLRKR